MQSCIKRYTRCFTGRRKKGFHPGTILPVLLILVLIGCTGRKNRPAGTSEKIVQQNDSSLLFDGATLSRWEITNFGPQGTVNVADGKIVLGMGDGCTGITYLRPFPEMNYEVSLDAMRIEGNDFFCGMTFPVGREPCTLIIGGWGGTVVGLSSINGMDASENETTRLMSFENGKWYHIRLKVAGGKIMAWIDNMLVVDFTKDDKALSVRPEVELSRPFGIATWRTTGALKNIRLNRL